METVRKWVQVITTFLMNGYWAFPFTRTIYQGPLKVICAPGLNCFSCPAATTYCSMGSLQQLLAGIRPALENGQYYLGFYVLGSIGVLGAFFGRMLCGFACPFGLIQEWIHKIPSPKFGLPRFLKYGKYLMLLFLVILLPLLVVDEFGGGTTWFCKYVCPAGTFEAGIPMLLLQPGLREAVGVLFYSKFLIMIIFFIWAVFVSRPFCRTTCPLGAFYALFARIRLIKLRLDGNKCTKCGACHRVCPMGVKFNEEPDDVECISCMACMTKACKDNAIYVEVGGIPLSRAPRPHFPETGKTT
jgi:ferredoxin-type protein NapH